MISMLFMLWAKSRREKHFHKVLHQFDASIQRVIRSYAKEHSLGEELKQEVALALWKALPTFEQKSSMKTFVYRVAHNTCIDYAIRKKRKEVLRFSHDGSEEKELATTANQEQQLSKQQAKLQLWNAIYSLPIKYRQVLTLALEECSYQEIAEIVGISEKNVSVRLNRAKKQLKDKITLGDIL